VKLLKLLFITAGPCAVSTPCSDHPIKIVNDNNIKIPIMFVLK
jgi:hypothetical protein